MITNKDLVGNKPSRKIRRSDEMVSGEAYTSYENCPWDIADFLDPAVFDGRNLTEQDIAILEMTEKLSDVQQAHLIERRGWITEAKWREYLRVSLKGHHPYQWACRQAFEPVRNFTEITDGIPDCQLRAMLELARLYRPSRSAPDLPPVVRRYVYLLKRDWDKDQGEIANVF